jgi:carbonic anhydrase
MQKLVTGIQQFRDHVFSEHRELFERLGKGQSPQTLFITCSDSRISPSWLTQTQPGELFILRNAGNLVPPYGSSAGGEAATIEYAVEALGVEDVVICGHSHCGAMKAVIEPEGAKALPAVSAWIQHAEPTRRLIQKSYLDRSPEEQLNVAIQENVLQQIANLRTHPAIAARMTTGKLRLHAWVYKITTGEVFSYDPGEGQFRPLSEVPTTSARTRSLDDALFGP